jgi:hypothetical protein
MATTIQSKTKELCKEKTMSEHECDRILRLEIEAEQTRSGLKEITGIIDELRTSQQVILHGIGNIKWFLMGFGVWIVASQMGWIQTIKAFL